MHHTDLSQLEEDQHILDLDCLFEFCAQSRLFLSTSYSTFLFGCQVPTMVSIYMVPAASVHVLASVSSCVGDVSKEQSSENEV
jgi:hypothetical protein